MENECTGIGRKVQIVSAIHPQAFRIFAVCLQCGNDTFIVERITDGQRFYACALCGGDPEVDIQPVQTGRVM